MRRVSATSLRTFVRNLTFLFHYRNSGLYGLFKIPGYPKPMQVVGKFVSSNSENSNPITMYKQITEKNTHRIYLLLELVFNHCQPGAVFWTFIETQSSLGLVVQFYSEQISILNRSGINPKYHWILILALPI
jgi:hypothetical protein